MTTLVTLSECNDLSEVLLLLSANSSFLYEHAFTNCEAHFYDELHHHKILRPFPLCTTRSSSTSLPLIPILRAQFDMHGRELRNAILSFPPRLAHIRKDLTLFNPPRKSPQSRSGTDQLKPARHSYRISLPSHFRFKLTINGPRQANHVPKTLTTTVLPAAILACANLMFSLVRILPAITYKNSFH